MAFLFVIGPIGLGMGKPGTHEKCEKFNQMPKTGEFDEYDAVIDRCHGHS
ncbi:MAG TPA: hypothetical protein PLK10_01610 [Ottowia sp.]|nr:hypothetical protein [Ottowia sp.]